MNLNLQTSDTAQYTKSFKEFLNGLKSPTENKDVGSTIATILNSAKSASDLQGCLSSVKSVAKYLSHDSEIVRNIAAEVLASLIGKAAELLSKETNPNTIKNAAKDLLEVVQKINDGSFSLSKGIQSDLNRAKQSIIIKLAETNKDQFVRFQENSQNVLPKGFTDRIDKTLNKAIKTLSGGMSPQQASERLNVITDNLIGI